MLTTLPGWVAASVVVYTLSAHSWAAVRRGRGMLPGFWRAVFPLAQALFMLGPPYAALLSGRITPARAQVVARTLQESDFHVVCPQANDVIERVVVTPVIERGIEIEPV